MDTPPLFDQMPSFRDPAGEVFYWDPSSKTYVKGKSNAEVDRGHSFGGDADLFSTNQIEHSEKTKNPLMEGYMAAKMEYAPPGQVLCPNCREPATDQSCALCGKDLTPEWLKLQDKAPGEDFNDQQAEHDVASEFLSWPDRVPKRNREKTDDSYPSMISSYNKNEIGSSLSGEPMRTAKPEYFDHVLHEEQWRFANEPSLDGCPECYSPMLDKSGEKVCHSCGHKQPIVHTAFLEAALPLAEGLLGGGEAAGAGAGGLEGLIGGGESGMPGMGEIGKLMNGALGQGQGQSGQPQEQQPQMAVALPGTIARTAGMFGDEEQGSATKNRGENSDPESGSGASFKEKGDGPELLKDVGGGPVDHDDQGGHGDPEQATKAFELNKPLVMEFFNSPEAGETNPILKALDELLEQAFPGYRNTGEEHGFEESLDQLPDTTSEDNPDAESPKEEKKERTDKKVSEGAVNTFWEVLTYDTMPQPATMPPPGAMGNPNAPCPTCGYPHDPNQPCGQPGQQPGTNPNGMQAPQVGAAPYAMGMQGITPPIPQKVVTYKTAVIAWPKKVAYDDYDDYGRDPYDDDYDGIDFADPGGNSALRAQGPNNPRNLPCPSCGHPNRLTPEDQARGYQCDSCANAAERGMDIDYYDGPEPMLGEPESDFPTLHQGAQKTAEPSVAEPSVAEPSVAEPSVAPLPKHLEAEEEEEESEPEQSVAPKHEFDVKTRKEEQEEKESKTAEHDHFEKHHGDSEWTDEAGQPLQIGVQYEMKSSYQPIPDRVTIVHVSPAKLVYSVHSGDVDYKNEMTHLDKQVNDYTFAAADDELDSMGGSDMGDIPPVRPGHDPTPQVDDLSSPSSVVSRDLTPMDEYTGSTLFPDNPESRKHLMEGSSSPVEVDPGLMAKLAGKDFTPREQREFIDEEGPARNLSKLNLEGTHYLIDDDDPELALW